MCFYVAVEKCRNLGTQDPHNFDGFDVGNIIGIILTWGLQTLSALVFLNFLSYSMHNLLNYEKDMSKTARMTTKNQNSVSQLTKKRK